MELKYLPNEIGIFTLSDKPIGRVEIVKKTAFYDKTEFEYMFDVTVPDADCRGGTFIGGKIAIDFGSDHDYQRIARFLKAWPKNNEYAGLRITKGAICSFLYNRLFLGVKIPLFYANHVALCLAFKYNTKTTGDMFDVAKAALESFLADKEIFYDKKIFYEEIFPFPGRETSIWGGKPKKQWRE